MYENLDIYNQVYLIYCDIGNYRHWVKESTDPEKFFSNFDKLITALKELTTINYEFLEPTPSSELNELQENEQKYYQQFLSRSWIKTVSDAAELKTDKGKLNKIHSFFHNIEPYTKRFSSETLLMIEKARQEQPDYTLKPTSKAEKDQLFFATIEKALYEQRELMLDIENESGNYAWFYQNNSILKSLMDDEISEEIIYSLTHLLLMGYDYRKGSRYISIKYNLDRKFAKKLYLCANRIIWARRDYLNLKKWYQNDPEFHNKYIILTHSSPCEKCLQHRGKVYNIKDAIFTDNFPPFCHRGCSTAHLFTSNDTSIPEPLSDDKLFFAKAVNLFEDEFYNEAAEYGLKAYNLVPGSYRYIQSVPEMLVKAGRIEEAAAILKEYLENHEPNPHIIKDFEKYSKRLEREKKKTSK